MLNYQDKVLFLGRITNIIKIKQQDCFENEINVDNKKWIYLIEIKYNYLSESKI